MFTICTVPNLWSCSDGTGLQIILGIPNWKEGYKNGLKFTSNKWWGEPQNKNKYVPLAVQRATFLIGPLLLFIWWLYWFSVLCYSVLKGQKRVICFHSVPKGMQLHTAGYAAARPMLTVLYLTQHPDFPREIFLQFPLKLHVTDSEQVNHDIIAHCHSIFNNEEQCFRSSENNRPIPECYYLFIITISII